MIGIAGCSDSGTGVDHGEPPSLPELQNAEAKPDLSFFTGNQLKTVGNSVLADTSNFYDARAGVLTNNSLFAVSQIYSQFFSAANQKDASYNDGVWEWEYAYSYEGQSVEVRLTAQEANDGYNWAMYWSYDGVETSFADYKILEGTSSADGSKGDWTFNALNPDTDVERPAFKSSWTVSSDAQKTMKIEVYDDSGSTSLTVDFERDGNDNILTFTFVGAQGGTLVVYWNSQTHSGYVIQEGTKRCWDENFVNTPCS
ncbi:MAG: hypothetical protein PVI44_06915 [Balneolaceae bacterium]